MLVGDLIGKLQLKAPGVSVDHVLVVGDAEGHVVTPTVGRCPVRVRIKRVPEEADVSVRADILLILQFENACRIPTSVTIIRGNYLHDLGALAVQWTGVRHARYVGATAGRRPGIKIGNLVRRRVR